jgi:hypothetical protein
MSKLIHLQEQFEAKVAELKEVQNELEMLKNSLGKTTNQFILFKKAKESEILNCINSRPKNWPLFQSKSWPHVPMDQCPFKDFWEAKERRERQLREQLETHERTYNDGLTVPRATIRSLETKEISLNSELTMIQAQINCCPKLKSKRNKK